MNPHEPIHVGKMLGSDTEVGGYVGGGAPETPTFAEAAELLLGEIEGFPQPVPRPPRAPAMPRYYVCGDGQVISLPPSTAENTNPQDVGRRYLAGSGGCAYIDLDHLELCVPECASARSHLAAHHATLRIARDAQDRVNARLADGRRLHVLVRNTDNAGQSYGGHINVLTTRRAWDAIFDRQLHHLLWLAAFQCSSIIFTGQGKVGAEHGAEACDFQLSQRADFFERVVGWETTTRRPIVNSRDEPLCGRPAWRDAQRPFARLHCIFYDTNLCHTAHLLKVGVLQIIVAMLETGRVTPKYALEDPVAAVRAWSHDSTLRTRARLASGRRLTALEMQMLFCEAASAFVESGAGDALVPEARTIVALWSDTLARLQSGDFDTLARRLDWVLKMRLCERTLARRPDLSWASPELLRIDQLYGALDGGLYFACEKSGAVDTLVSSGDIERAMHTAPEETRAWTRSKLLGLAAAEDPRCVEEVDWDTMVFRLPDAHGRMERWRVALDDPLAHTRATSPAREAETLSAALEALDATFIEPPRRSYLP